MGLLIDKETDETDTTVNFKFTCLLQSKEKVQLLWQINKNQDNEGYCLSEIVQNVYEGLNLLDIVRLRDVYLELTKTNVET